MTVQSLVPVVAHATGALIPAEIPYRQILATMDYRVEWVATHACLPEYLCQRYWKSQVVTDDREELLFYRRQELEEHAQEIEHWSAAGYNVLLAWQQVLKNCEKSIQEKGGKKYTWQETSFPNPRSGEMEVPYTPIEQLFRDGSVFIDFHEIQARVIIVITQLADDLQLLRKLEQQWIGCETWERAKANRETTRTQQEREAQEQAVQLRKERRAAERQTYDEMDTAYEEALEQVRTGKEQAQKARKESRTAERRMQGEMETAYEATVTQHQHERKQKEEQERRQNPATYTDPVTKAEEQFEEYLLKFRRRYPPPDGDLSVCESETIWKKALREQLDKDDAEDVIDRYEKLARKLRNALEDFRATCELA